MIRRALKWVAALSAAVLLMTSGATPATAQQPFQPHFEPTSCAFTLPSDWTDGVNVRCGFVVVEAWHGQPDRGVTRLAAAIFKSSARDPGKEPIVYLGGGPSNTIDRLVPPVLRAFTPSRDVVIIDHRGVEYSQPSLGCPGVIAQTVADWALPPDPAAQVTHAAAAMLACRDQLLAQGVDLAAYSFIETAKDIGDVATALGYPKVDLYGVSFGTKLALQAMRESPQRIHAVVLNSGRAPDHFFDPDPPNPVGTIREQVWQACEADPKCSQAFPGVRDLFEQVRQQLNSSPVQVPYAIDGVTHTALIDGSRFSSLVAALPSTPQMVWEVAHGNYSVLAPVIPPAMGIFGPIYSVAAHMTMQCEMLKAEGGISPTSIYGLVCPGWPTVALDPAVTQPISSPIPVLIMNATWDARVPFQQGQYLAEELRHSTAIVPPGLGHAFPPDSNECLLSIQNAFLDHASQVPDTSCVAQLRITFPGV